MQRKVAKKIGPNLETPAYKKKHSFVLLILFLINWFKSLSPAPTENNWQQFSSDASRQIRIRSITEISLLSPGYLSQARNLPFQKRPQEKYFRETWH